MIITENVLKKEKNYHGGKKNVKGDHLSEKRQKQEMAWVIPRGWKKLRSWNEGMERWPGQVHLNCTPS